MQKLLVVAASSLLVLVVAQLAVGSAACTAPESSGEGEGEGEEVPGEAGGVSFTNTFFEIDHTVGTTTCPQELGSFTLSNSTAEDRVVNFTPDGLAIDLVDSSDNLLTFVSLAPNADFDVTVRFNCSITESFTRKVGCAVTNGAGDQALGDVTVTAKMNISN